MRVISGSKKGHRLLAPKNNKSRPTEDKIKEAVFNILYPIKDNCLVLDLFACTGSIGVEFLSRGAKKVYFSEINPSNISLLRENLDRTHFLDDAVILRGSFLRNLERVDDSIDYVYIDPPYESDYYEKALNFMVNSPLFYNSKFIVEEDKLLDYSDRISELAMVFQRKYGRKVITIYERKKNESNLPR